MRYRLTAVAVMTIATAVNARAQSQSLKRVLDAHAHQGANQGRIVGGHDTSITAQPWQVALVAASINSNADAQFCGGSLVADRWVITAAHCVDGGTKPADVAVLSATDSLVQGGVRTAVSSIVVHEGWSSATHDNDVALLQLASPVAGSAIAGWTGTDPAAGTEVTVTGWGATAWHVQGTTKLQAVNVPVVARDNCNRKLSYDGKITEGMLCAGKQNLDSCQGDSGGPLTAKDQTTRRLVGIVSWGEGCGMVNKPGVYTRVSRFAAWVNARTQGAVNWQASGGN